MALSCIIVDDEPLAVKLLESFVTKTPDLDLLGSYTDSVEAINAVKEQRPNLLFLDIQMPDLNGMELAHMIPEGTKVIFTTAFKEYAFGVPRILGRPTFILVVMASFSEQRLTILCQALCEALRQLR